MRPDTIRGRTIALVEKRHAAGETTNAADVMAALGIERQPAANALNQTAENGSIKKLGKGVFAGVA